MNEETSATTVLRLRPPKHQVSRKAMGYWAVWAAVFWLIVLTVQTVIVTTSDDAPTWITVTLVISCVLTPLHLLVMPRWRYRIHRWEVTGEAVYTQSGWIKQQWRLAPISRIQTVDIERDPVEQLFGLAKLTITTASAAGPLRIAGLDRAQALALADELTSATQAIRGDAT
ncbi:PH domain-containing protein [Amycolatopsis sp. H20-H5]|uniref:PH domain-containing protein n=1 Tax=Amycolatopsis sp. H20-H5 TaxID=3046309 RepID=UPI002DBE2FC9|nr:PH domain-containing protein [Amycolatopsis sp. H20-H5]MEC3978601.1 PH domain-containing protein [Amycolatopsis sp. H20-H5]